MNFESAEHMLGNADYVIEASSDAKSRLWVKWNEEVEWVGCSGGFGKTVSHLQKGDKKFPVFISLMSATIQGKVFVFWEATSMLVDHYAIQEYIEKTAYNRYNPCRNYDVQDFSGIMDDIIGGEEA